MKQLMYQAILKMINYTNLNVSCFSKRSEHIMLSEFNSNENKDYDENAIND